MDPEMPAEPPGGAPPGQSPLSGEAPRLGISHLLAWTFCVALVLGVIRLLIGGTGLGIWEGVSVLVLGLYGGTALGSLLVLPARRRRGQPFPVHPGEYLWVIHGISAAVGLTPLCVSSVVATPIDSNGLVLSGLLWTTPCLTPLLMLWPAIYSPRTGWTAYFWLTPATLLFCGIGAEGIVFGQFGRIFVLALLLVATLVDRKEHISYPWTHWVGLILELSTAVAFVLLALRVWI